MIGTILLAILGVLLLALAAALLIPAKVRFSYDQGEMALWIRYGPLKIRLFPPKEKKPKQPPPSQAEAPETPEKEPEKTKRAKKPRAKINLQQILYSLETLPPILVRALRRTGRRIRVGPLKIHLLIACGDPADTAQLYGRIQAALAAGLPILHRAVSVKDQDIQLFPDFLRDRMDCIADVGASLRPWDLVSVGIRAGGSGLKWFLGFRRLASPRPSPKQEQTAPEGEAVEKAGGEAA